MTIHDEDWTERLSKYLDGELPDADRRVMTAHLAECAECAQTLGELRIVVARAQSLEPREPETDLWAGIASRIQETPRAGRVVQGPWRRFSFTVPQLAAASVLLAAISGWAAMRFISPTLQPGAPAAVDASASVSADSTSDIVPAAAFDDAVYDEAVSDLERALQSGRGRLDPTTVQVVEDNLRLIDQAVDDARKALESDPANSYLSGYLLETRRRKLDLLRRATALTEDLN